MNIVLSIAANLPDFSSLCKLFSDSRFYKVSDVRSEKSNICHLLKFTVIKHRSYAVERKINDLQAFSKISHCRKSFVFSKDLLNNVSTA